MKCEGEKWTWNDSDNGEYFSRAMSCLSILRSACDRVSELHSGYRAIGVEAQNSFTGTSDTFIENTMASGKSIQRRSVD